MATVSVQATPGRTVRAATSPPSVMYTRPWRSSPLAFSTLPPIISESSEDEDEIAVSRDLAQSRSPSSLSIVSQASVSASSALLLVEGEASTSSISLSPSSQSHGRRYRTTSPPPPDVPPKSASEASITPPPRARTNAHSRPVSLPAVVPSPTIPPTYSRASPLPSEPNNAKHPPSTSRDPSSNWMSSSPFGPAQTPKFSRLAMASPAVVMPLSAREYRKRKAKAAMGTHRPFANHVEGIDNTMSASQGPNGIPLVTVSSPPSDDTHQPRMPPPSFRNSSPDPQSPPQPQTDHPPAKRASHGSSKRRASHARPRSRPNTPPRSSPLAAHPPISPKSSAGTFYSLASNSDDDAQGTDAANAVPAARPRPRPLRRKSYPDRLSNGARLSLLEAMNRLSQEGTALQRLSVASQASGHTLFYDVDVGGDGGNDSGDDDNNANANGDTAQRTSVLHTQSLEDLSSTLARTGIEVVRSDREGDVDGDEERKGKRNVRMVRISDTVEVSPAPVPRRRKLTKSRRGSVRRSVQGVVKEPVQTQDRRSSLLPWKSRGSGDGKASEKSSEDGHSTKNIVPPDETAVPSSLVPTLDGSTHLEDHPKPESDGTRNPTPVPTSPPKVSPPSSPRKERRSTFSFLSASAFSRPKHDKSDALPAGVDLGLDPNIKIQPNGVVKSVEDGTDSASTSTRTITQGSQRTLTPAKHASSTSAVPMLRRLTAQEMDLENAGALSRNEWNGDSTPSLVTNGSTATTSSSPRTPSVVRLSGGVYGGGEFVPRLSGLKESSTSEEDAEGVHRTGRSSRASSGRHRKVDASPLVRGGETSTSEEEERLHGHGPLHVHLRASSSPGLLSPIPRPGTSSSTLTTATETSGSYASFSTVPASTTSSNSTSRSTSPSPPIEEKQEQEHDRDRDRVRDLVEDIEVHACAMCGHIARSTSPVPEPERMVMHPMFTVPLVTVPALAVSYPRSAQDLGTRMVVRDGGMGMGMGRRSERQPSMAIPGTGPKNDHGHMHGVGAGAIPRVALATPPKAKKRRRPQTAPAGSGEMALKFIEETKARGGVMDVAKPKGGESKIRAVLKGWLRWNA